MWYGGWQDPGQVNDNIYYRTSSDGINWSGYVTVLSPQGVASAYGSGISLTHVNDPSVIKVYNTVSSKVEYVMLFTACNMPCTQGSQRLS